MSCFRLEPEETETLMKRFLLIAVRACRRLLPGARAAGPDALTIAVIPRNDPVFWP